jgi:hypothetical protein
MFPHRAVATCVHTAGCEASNMNHSELNLSEEHAHLHLLHPYIGVLMRRCRMKAQCATSSGPTLMTGQRARLFMLLDMHVTRMSAGTLYDARKMAGIVS